VLHILLLNFFLFYLNYAEFSYHVDGLALNFCAAANCVVTSN